MKTLKLSIIIAAAGIAVILSVLFFTQMQYGSTEQGAQTGTQSQPSMQSQTREQAAMKLATKLSMQPPSGQQLQLSNIQLNPQLVTVGQSFFIYADTFDPNSYPMYVNVGCVSSLSATFDKNVETKQGKPCDTTSQDSVGPRGGMRISGPSVGTTYVATSPGTTNATIAVSYSAEGKIYNVTISKQFIIEPSHQ